MKNLRDMKPIGTRGNWINDNDYNKIWDDVCDWLDKNIDRFVSNIQQVYALTGNEVGYDTLSKDWYSRRSWSGVGDIIQFSSEDIRNNIIEKIYCPMCWLYQQNDYGQGNEFNQGFTGLMVIFHLNVIKRSEISDPRLTYSFNLSLNIQSGYYKEIK